MDLASVQAQFPVLSSYLPSLRYFSRDYNNSSQESGLYIHLDLQTYYLFRDTVRPVSSIDLHVSFGAILVLIYGCDEKE